MNRDIKLTEFIKKYDLNKSTAYRRIKRLEEQYPDEKLTYIFNNTLFITPAGIELLVKSYDLKESNPATDSKRESSGADNKATKTETTKKYKKQRSKLKRLEKELKHSEKELRELREVNSILREENKHQKKFIDLLKEELKATRKLSELEIKRSKQQLKLLDKEISNTADTIQELNETLKLLVHESNYIRLNEIKTETPKDTLITLEPANPAETAEFTEYTKEDTPTATMTATEPTAPTPKPDRAKRGIATRAITAFRVLIGK